MKFLKTILLFVVIVSCSNDESALEVTLSDYIANETIENSAVIACAAKDNNTDNVLVFYYPEEGATNVRIYETETITVDASDFSNYRLLNTIALPVFNGYLENRMVSLENEKWIIVTFEMDGEVKISNPIRTKQESKVTIWDDAIDIDLSIPELPIFSWIDNPYGDNAIYFQVITDFQNNLLSGTYTYDNAFQYYNTSNVVLNITTETPPSLISGATYKFTLMDVSQDNWVSHVAEKNFNIL